MCWDWFPLVQVCIVFGHDLTHHGPERAAFLFTSQSLTGMESIDMVL